MKHPIISLILIIIVIGIISSVANNSQPRKVGETSSNGTSQSTQQPEQKTPATQVYKIGDKVDLEGKTVAVNGVAGYTSKNQFMTPKSGNKFVGVDLTLTNSSKDAFSYNALDFRLQDDKDYSYSHAVSDQEPHLTYGAVQPGEKVRGFITYEIPASNTPAKFIFTPGFLSTSQIIINLVK